MIDTINLGIVKKKFGKLLSKMYTDAGMSVDIITDSLLKWDMPEKFENNFMEEFMNSSIETLAKQLGCGSFVFSDETDMVLFWTGVQYMNIFFNTGVPLKQVFLTLPLEEMINRFDLFHEMNEREIVKEFIFVHEKKSILKLLRNRVGMKISALSYLTGISANTLKYYEKTNNNLFSASFVNIEKVKRVLNCSASFFCRKSEFIPYSENLWNDLNFVSAFRNSIKTYLNVETEEIGIVTDESAKSNKEPFLYLGTICYLQKNRKKKQIPSCVVEKAISTAVDAALAKNNSVNLYF